MNRNGYNGQSPLSGARARAQRIVVITAAGAKTFSSRQLARLDAAGEVEFYERTEPLPAAELIDLVEGATVIAVTPRSVPDLSGDTLDALPSSVTGIAVFATGLDFVDLEAAAARGIAVSNLTTRPTRSRSTRSGFCSRSRGGST